jgi:hypothetical protein
MTYGPLTGVAWFDRLWPLGMGASFGPEPTPACVVRLTMLEAAVLALTLPGLVGCRHDAWILKDVPISQRTLTRVKRSLQRKHEAWQRAYHEGHRGRRILRLAALPFADPL